MFYPLVKNKTSAFFILCLNPGPWSLIKAVICDKGYAGYEVQKKIKDPHCQPVMPPQSNRVFPRTYDKEFYRTRHPIERVLDLLNATTDVKDMRTPQDTIFIH